MDTPDDPRVPYDRMASEIERVEPGSIRAGRNGAPWRVSFTRRAVDASDQKWASTDVLFFTQGELIDLWQKTGALFNLAGMREGLTDEDLKRMGVDRGK